MVVFIPRGWGDSLSLRDGVSVYGEYSPTGVRNALEMGQKLFLIGADALGQEKGWFFASDHIALFGTGDLAGANHDDLGPRFPNLRGMYLVPSLSGEVLPHGTVLRVPDIRLTTGAELKGLPCDAVVSQGMDLAVIAGHGGARVIFALNRRTPEDNGNNSFSFLNRVIREIEGGEE
jgi:hypothetical protein